MSYIVVTKGWGQLCEGAVSHPIELDLIVNRCGASEPTQSIMRVDLSSRQCKPKPGAYKLIFTFNGKEELHSVEVTSDGCLILRD